MFEDNEDGVCVCGEELEWETRREGRLGVMFEDNEDGVCVCGEEVEWETREGRKVGSDV